MALTRTKQILISGLQAFGATQNMAAAILMLLDDKEPLQEELINYMVEHQKATPRELLEQAIEMVRYLPEDGSSGQGADGGAAGVFQGQQGTATDASAFENEI